MRIHSCVSVEELRKRWHPNNNRRKEVIRGVTTDHS